MAYTQRLERYEELSLVAQELPKMIDISKVLGVDIYSLFDTRGNVCKLLVSASDNLLLQEARRKIKKGLDELCKGRKIYWTSPENATKEEKRLRIEYSIFSTA